MKLPQEDKIINYFIRKIKIHKLTPVLNKNELEMISFIKNILNNLIVFKYNKFTNSTFYMFNNKWFGEYDDVDDILYISIEDFWKNFSNIFYNNKYDIEIIFKYFFEKKFKYEYYKLEPLSNKHWMVSDVERDFREII